MTATRTCTVQMHPCQRPRLSVTPEEADADTETVFEKRDLRILRVLLTSNAPTAGSATCSGTHVWTGLKLSFRRGVPAELGDP